MLEITIIFLVFSIAAYHLVVHDWKLDLFRIFCYVWLIICVSARINIFGYNEISSHLEQLFFIGIFFWIIGFYISRVALRNINICYGTNLHSPSLLFPSNPSINKKLLLFIEILTFIFIVLLINRISEIIISGYSYGEVHGILYGNSDEVELFKSRLLNGINNRLLTPMLLAFIPVCVVLFVKKQATYLSFTGLLLVIIYGIISSRRSMLAYIMVDFLLMLSLFSESIDQKRKKKLIIFSIAAFVIMVIITIFRKNLYESGNWSYAFDVFLKYFSLSVPVSDYWINHIDHTNIWTYGMAFFGGIFSLIDLFIRQLGIRFTPHETMTDLIHLTNEIFIPIGSGSYANAFVTWIFYFYLDFREVGVALGSLIFGFIIGRVELRIRNTKNLMMTMFYLLVMQSVLKSFVRWEFGYYIYILSFVFLRMMFVFSWTNKIKLKLNSIIKI